MSPWTVSSRLQLTAFVAFALLAACKDRQHLLQTGADTRSIILVRGNGPGPESLDPQKAETVEAQMILRDLYECLTSLDHEAKPAPGAAQRWSVSPDGKTYTFVLRTDARWSNGDPVTGADFVAGLRRLVDPATASSYAQVIDVIGNARAIVSRKLPVEALSVVAPDAGTVVIGLEQPAPYFPALLSHPSTCPLHRPTFKQVGNKFARPGVMVSNGAFTLTQWISGQYVLTHRNPFYWNNHSNRIDGVKWLQISDENAEYRRYRSGEIDITSTVPRAPIADIQKAIPRELHLGPALGTDYYGFNLSRPPFRDNAPLRRALMLAVDRDRIVRSLLGFGERAAYGWVPYGVQGYQTQSMSDGLSSAADRLGESRRLFREAGYSDHRPLHFELWYNANEVHRMLAVAIAAMWHDALGVEVTLMNVDFPTLLQDVEAQRVDMFRSSWIGDYNDAESFLQIFASDSGTNLPHYRSSEYDALLTEAAAQTNLDTRTALLEHAERILLRDAPVIPVYFHVGAHLVKPRVQGWYQNVMNVAYSKDLSLAP
jgi:oligopeptide transport system substrate-binding protein